MKDQRNRAQLTAAVVLATSILTEGLALAAPPAKTPTSAPSAAAPPGPTTKIEEARQHFERGVKLYEDKAYDAARAEFMRAYELAPTYRLLYNLGLIQKAQSDFVGALGSFRTYLKEGGVDIESARLAEVGETITELEKRVARLQIKANVTAPEIMIDDVATKPDADGYVLANPGRRRVTVSKTGKLPITRAVDVTGSDTTTLDFKLEDNRAVVVVSNRRVPWVLWGVALGLGAVATGTGIWALSTKSELQDTKDSNATPNPDDLSSLSTKATVLGITTDVLAVGAIAVGGVAAYYTIKWGKESESGQNVGFGIGPGRASIIGTF